MLSNGKSSTLLDEFLINFSPISSKMSPGLLCVSGDVLLEFNPFDIEIKNCDSACLSMKEKAEIGCNHGVFLVDKKGEVKEFLHKKKLEELERYGAINSNNLVDIDTGAIYFSYKVIRALISMLLEEEKDKFINDMANINLYGDIVYPFATNATLGEYKKQETEGKGIEEVSKCRRKLWEVLNQYSMKVLRLHPAKFTHLGTTNELMEMVSKEIDRYKDRKWTRKILTNIPKDMECTFNTVYVSENLKIGKKSYIEYSYIGENCKIGENVMLSNTNLSNITVPDNICMSTIKLKNGKYVTRIYSIKDDFKQEKINKIQFLGINLYEVIEKYKIDISLIWKNKETSLWNANLFCVCNTEEESIISSLKLYEIICCQADSTEVKKYFSRQRISGKNSSYHCDRKDMKKRREEIEIKVRTEKFIKSVEKKQNLCTAIKILEKSCNIKNQISDVNSKINKNMAYETRYRIYLALSMVVKKNKELKISSQHLMDLCYEEIKNMITLNFDIIDFKQTKDRTETELPIRVNFGGGWTDTPPYCNENGGSVLNAAFQLNEKNPIKASIKKIEEKVIILESKDLNIRKKITDIEELKKLNQEKDDFKIHKTSLMITGIVKVSDKSIEEVIARIGKGFIFSTNAKDIPKGSGLGTSSILSGACLKTLYDFLNIPIDEKELCSKVLWQEQLMGTGGGWQDQIGGLTKGIKLTTTKPGKVQKFAIQELKLSNQLIEELNTRFVLIYTGQQRIAKNLLRTIMNQYIISNQKTIETLNEIKLQSIQMKQALEKEDLEEFSNCLNQHWELSKKLDKGCTNDRIEEIFRVCDELIQGKMICGAGGGGFLQVVLKKGKTKEMLEQKLKGSFPDKAIKVYSVTLFA